MITLLKKGANATLTDNWDKTPAQAASEHGENAIAGIIQAFLDGKYIDKVDTPSQTHKSKNVPRTKILSKMMEAPLNTDTFLHWLKKPDIDITRCDMYKWTPLHKLASWNKAECITALLADSRISDKDCTPSGQGGDTPVHCAVEMHAGAALEALLKDVRVQQCVNVKNERGLAPADVATQCNNVEAFQMLSKFGATAGHKEKKAEHPSHLPEHYGMTEKRTVHKLDKNKFSQLSKMFGAK